MQIELKILDNLKSNRHFTDADDKAIFEYSLIGPCKAKRGDAGMDLRACLDEPVIVLPNESVMIPTGLAIWIAGTEGNIDAVGLLVPRSGLGSTHGLVLGNLTGVIDSHYQGEIKICVWNRSETAYKINPADRIAQLLIVPIVPSTFKICDEFSNISDRSSDGFGSTGK